MESCPFSSEGMDAGSHYDYALQSSNAIGPAVLVSRAQRFPRLMIPRLALAVLGLAVLGAHNYTVRGFGSTRLGCGWKHSPAAKFVSALKLWCSPILIARVPSLFAFVHREVTLPLEQYNSIYEHAYFNARQEALDEQKRESIQLSQEPIFRVSESCNA